MTLEDLLEEARRAGTVESAGTFTMDFQAAVEKLRGFQIENQYHYVNRLVRAASLAGAQEVHITTGANQTRVHFPALPCAPGELPQLFEQLFQNARPAARELATAVNLALALKPARIEIQVDQQVLALEGEQRGKEYYPRGELYETSVGQPGTTFQLSRSLGKTLSVLGAQSPELLAIVKRFRYSPMKILINRELLKGHEQWGAPRVTGKFFTTETVALKASFWSLPTRFYPRHHAAELRVYDDDPEANQIGLGPSRATGLVTLGQRGDCERCFVALGLCADPKRPSTASFVYRGETLQKFPVRLPIPGVELLVSAHALPLDLSGEQLAQGEAFETRWTQAKSYFELLQEALQRAYPGVSGHGLTLKALFDPQARWRVDP